MTEFLGENSESRARFPIISLDRRQNMHWLVLYSRTRGGKTMTDKLAGEIVDAANGRGGAVKKKEDVHRMAEANKAFAHYRW